MESNHIFYSDVGKILNEIKNKVKEMAFKEIHFERLVL